MTHPQARSALHQALAKSITSTDFIDTAYFLYSSRTRHGVGGQKAVLANSSTMQAEGSFFRQQLSKKAPRVPAPADNDYYDYMSDSDLEDDDATNEDEENQSVKSSTSSVSSLASSIHLLDDDDDISSQDPYAYLKRAYMGRTYPRTVAVVDFAAATWQALVFYIYTGEIKFAPLRCEGPRHQEEVLSKTERKIGDDFPTPCSPKSMYRLADAVGLEELKDIAFQEICNRFTQARIVDEVFSTFTSRYPELLQAEVDFIFSHPLTTQEAAGLKNNVRLAVQGKIPHAQRAMASLFEHLPLLIACPPTLEPEPIVKDTVTNGFEGQDGDPSALHYPPLVKPSLAEIPHHSEVKHATEETKYPLAVAQCVDVECQDLCGTSEHEVLHPEDVPPNVYPGLFGGPGRAAIAKKKKKNKPCYNFVDTVFYVYSSRESPKTRTRTVKRIYANYELLQSASPQLRDQLSSKFKGSALGDHDQSEDSDFEDDVDDDDGEDNDGKSATSDPSSNNADEFEVLASAPHSVLQASISPNRTFKHVINVSGVAAKTWHAFVYYLYSGNVEFAPLRSERDFLRIKSNSPQCQDVQPCSPKSMYRLGVIFNMYDLKVKALSELQRGLHFVSRAGIMNEMFSKFTSRYSDVISLEVGHFLTSRRNADSAATDVTPELEGKIAQVVEGKLPHAKPVLMSLLKRRPESPSRPVDATKRLVPVEVASGPAKDASPTRAKKKVVISVPSKCARADPYGESYGECPQD
ncbi:hypothetical protein EIP91_000988 [Steccherinum ochraceum]|uniref:BTB domain-containing protein n=1 Tax=Steccherinum ochraceum TaxID=92696 RepID=A0A4V2MWM1_9APHY|nr:hypothetical protein EIP91_000988 [Steccherinum ochraceum]